MPANPNLLARAASDDDTAQGADWMHLSGISDDGPAPAKTADGCRTNGLDTVADATSPDVLPAVPNYAILGELGRGGMGVVYKARHLSLGRDVALKVILAGSNELCRERFRVEAQAAARLQHPGIVQVFDIGEHGDQPFFSMEYVEGGTLADQLQDGPMSPKGAATLLATIAEAVQHAHSRGLIHRDLKPANILISADNMPKVADFGLAKVLESDVGLTRPERAEGTPTYMAPEQADGQGRPVQPTIDVYGMGAILYECLTGRPPFVGANRIELLTQLLVHDPVPIRRLEPRVPRDLETICQKCLAKEPNRRYSSAAELEEDLRRFLDGKPIQARPAGAIERWQCWARRNRATATALGALAVTLILVAVVASVAAARFMTLAREREGARLSADRQRVHAE